MNRDIASFCDMAVKEALVTESHCRVLRGLCSPDMTLDRFTDLLRLCGVVTDDKHLYRILREVAKHRRDAPPHAETPPPTSSSVANQTPLRLPPRLPIEIDWLCFLVVAEGVLPLETVRSIVCGIHDAMDTLKLSQMLLLTRPDTDGPFVMELWDIARQAALSGRSPPFSVLSSPMDEITASKNAD